MKDELVRTFEELSPGKAIDSPSVPTLSFDTLVPVGTCARLIRTLEDVLGRTSAA